MFVKIITTNINEEKIENNLNIVIVVSCILEIFYVLCIYQLYVYTKLMIMI